MKKSTRKGLKYWPILIVLIMVIASSCSKSKSDEAYNSGVFPVSTPRLVDTVYTKEYVTEIQARKNVEIRSKVAGFLEGIHVDEGDFVRKGQILFTVSGRQYTVDLQRAEAALSAAQADFNLARVELENTRLLVGKNIEGESQLEMAEAKADAAKSRIGEAHAAVSMARLQLELSQIRAPFDGVINRIPYKIGSLIEEGTLFTNISDDKEVFAYFNITENEYLDFEEQHEKSLKRTVNLFLANGKKLAHEGTIETVENQIDSETGNLTYRARFTNENGLLKHGSSGKISITHKLDDALLVPRKSVFEVQDIYYVFVVTKGDTVRRRQVTPTMRLDNYYVIGSGISQQEQIVLEGTIKLNDGDKINIKSKQVSAQKVSQNKTKVNHTAEGLGGVRVI